MQTLNQIIGKVIAKQAHKHPESFVSNEAGALASSAGALLQIAEQALKLKQDYIDPMSEGSLSTYTRAANLHPRVIIEENLKSIPSLSKWMMTMTNIFMGYYLQSVALSAQVNGCRAIGVLDQFNPDRNDDLTPAVLKTLDYFASKGGASKESRLETLDLISKESRLEYGYVLPNYRKKENTYFIRPAKALEANDDNLYGGLTRAEYEKLRLERDKFDHQVEMDHIKMARQQKLDAENAKKEAELKAKQERKEQLEELEKRRKFVKPALNRIMDVDNLAVGRWVDVSINLNGQQVEVPVAVRMRPMYAPTIIMRELVAYGDIEETWTERWHRFRAGELNFSDFILQSDRIRHQKKLIKMDKSGILMDMLKRRAKNHRAAASTGRQSIGAASSFVLVTKETVDDVVSRTGASFDNEMIREQFFMANSAMILIIVDTRWERLTVYTRGIPSSANYSFKDFEGFSKGDGPDIMSIFKAFQMGNSPRF